MTKLPLVVLAAGKGTRLQPLTNTVPKPLLKVQGKAVLEHTLENIQEFISEIIIVVSYMPESFETYFSENWNGIPVKIVKQQEPIGTGNALYSAKDVIQGDWFYTIYGDDYYGKDLFEGLTNQEGAAIIGKETENWQRYGVFAVDEQNQLVSFVEKPQEFISNLVNPGCFKLHRSIFDTYANLQASPRGEMEINNMIMDLKKVMPVQIVHSTGLWMSLGYPWDLLDLAEYILSVSSSNIQGVVENGAVVKGKLQLGEGSVIKAGTYIDGDIYIGKNCSIGPNTYIRKFASIGDNCTIGANTEIKSSIIGDGSKVPHLAYLPDSILGNNVNYAAGSITADLKHDGSNIRSMVNGELVDTGKRKLGTIIGDNAKTGINTTIFPGRKIWNDKVTMPGEIVKEDIRD